jgi:hypothetical protein
LAAGFGHHGEDAGAGHFDVEEGEGVAFDDAAEGFAGDGGQVGAHGHLVDGVDGFDALAGGGEREVATEEEFIDDLELVGADEGVVGDPGAAEEAGEVGEDVLVLAEEDEGFIDPGVAEVSDDDFEVGEAAGDFIEEEGAGVFHLGFGREMGAGVEDDGEVERGGFFVDFHGAGVGGVKILGGGADGQALEVELPGDVLDLGDGVVVGRIDAGETDDAVGVFVAVIGDVFVGDRGAKVAAGKAEDEGAVDGFGSEEVVGGVGLGKEAYSLAGNMSRPGEFGQGAVAELLGTLPDMRMTVDDHERRLPLLAGHSFA